MQAADGHFFCRRLDKVHNLIIIAGHTVIFVALNMPATRSVVVSESLQRVLQSACALILCSARLFGGILHTQIPLIARGKLIEQLFVLPIKPSRRPCELFIALIVRPSLFEKAEYFIFERLLLLHKAFEDILVRERLFGKMRVDFIADLQCTALPDRSVPLANFLLFGVGHGLQALCNGQRAVSIVVNSVRKLVNENALARPALCLGVNDDTIVFQVDCAVRIGAVRCYERRLFAEHNPQLCPDELSL